MWESHLHALLCRACVVEFVVCLEEDFEGGWLVIVRV